MHLSDTIKENNGDGLTTGSRVARVSLRSCVNAILKRTKDASESVDPIFLGSNWKCAKCSVWCRQAVPIASYNSADALWINLDSSIFFGEYAVATCGVELLIWCFSSFPVCFAKVRKSWLSFRRSSRHSVSRDSEKLNLSFFCIRDRHALSAIDRN